MVEGPLRWGVVAGVGGWEDLRRNTTTSRVWCKEETRNDLLTTPETDVLSYDLPTN